MRVGRGRMATQQQERQPVLKEARGSGEMRSGDGVGGRSNPDWQRRRGELNHDWLKGRYIPDLDRWLNLINGLVENQVFEEEFLNLVLPKWEEVGGIISVLARDFEHQMSPRCFLDQRPLSRCPAGVRPWLGDLAHELWLKRYPVRRWTTDVIAAVAAADASYAHLRDHEPKPNSASTAASLQPLFERFRADCGAVANSVAQFPNDVRVT